MTAHRQAATTARVYAGTMANARALVFYCDLAALVWLLHAREGQRMQSIECILVNYSRDLAEYR
jgi:hypothetical protein